LQLCWIVTEFSWIVAELSWIELNCCWIVAELSWFASNFLKNPQLHLLESLLTQISLSNLIHLADPIVCPLILKFIVFHYLYTNLTFHWIWSQAASRFNHKTESSASHSWLWSASGRAATFGFQLTCVPTWHKLSLT
jgi:hypothetical protein